MSDGDFLAFAPLQRAARVAHRALITMGSRSIAVIACVAALFAAGPAGAMPLYMSYFGLGSNIPEAQDHVNLYWAVSWDWDGSKVLSQLSDAKARGMRAIVHTEFALFNGSGPYANSCPYTLKPDAAARWDAFAQALSERGLLATIAAFYPADEPDICGLSPDDIQRALNVIRAHPLTTGKPVATIFTCDIAKKYGGIYRLIGGHRYGDAVRAYDWVGVDCYGSENIFTDPAWSSIEWDSHCFCFRSVPGPSYYDNLKAQLSLPAQRLILVPQGFIAADGGGLPDNPQLFASQAAADPSVVLMAPFTWFDQTLYPGVRSQPALAEQWRTIGRSISMSNPPATTPPLPPAVPPRLRVRASDVQHFFVYDLGCNSTNANPCSAQLHWQAANAAVGTQLFLRQNGTAPRLIACSPAAAFVDTPWIADGNSYTFDLYQTGSCGTSPGAGAIPIASVNLALADSSAPPAAANYQGLWWAAPPGSESGWGINFAHQGDVVFATWFTYDAAGKPWWLIAELHQAATGDYSGSIFTVTGPAFNTVPYAPAPMETSVGTMTVSFSDELHGSLAYTVNGISQTKAIVPQQFGPLPFCTWGAQSKLALATNYTDLWWNAGEPGWGISFAHQGDLIFATWFTYDATGKPWWLIAELHKGIGDSYTGPVSTVSGQAFDTVPWNTNIIVEAAVGTATATFANGNGATFAYTVSGVSQSKPITRQVFAPPGTVCQ